MIGGGNETKINWSLNPKYSDKICKSAGAYLDFNSYKIPFDDKSLNPDKEELFYMPNVYHRKLNGP